MGAETDLSPPPPPLEPTASLEPEILTRDDRSWKADMMSALGESVSFGRFLAEPLEWGKWSAFEHKRYIEEAAGQSRPGSVAQKKAFFEDHYAKKRKSEADDADHAGCDEEDVEVDPHDPADGGVAASSADSSCMTDGEEETRGVDPDAPDRGGGVDAAGPVEALQELKAETDGLVRPAVWLTRMINPTKRMMCRKLLKPEKGYNCTVIMVWWLLLIPLRSNRYRRVLL